MLSKTILNLFQLNNKKLKLVNCDDSVLKIPAQEVLPGEIDSIIAQEREFIDFMNQNSGVGLAAPQVGINKRFFVWREGIVINPKIVNKGQVIIDSVEGCLSFPNQIATVKRHRVISVEYIGRNKKLVSRKLTGLQAVIFQHEFDHLMGICIF